MPGQSFSVVVVVVDDDVVVFFSMEVQLFCELLVDTITKLGNHVLLTNQLI